MIATFRPAACIIISMALTAGASAKDGVLGPYVSWIASPEPLIVLHTREDSEVSLSLPSGGQSNLKSRGKHHHFRVPKKIMDTPGEVPYSLDIGGLALGQYNLSVPDPAANSFSFVVMGDSQAGTSKRRHEAMNASLQFNPCFIIHTGDLLVGKSAKGNSGDIYCHDWRVNFFEPMPALQASIPFFPVFGNHDDEVEGQRMAFSKAFPDMPESGCYSFSRGPVAFFFLDIQNQISEFFRKGQDKWLENEVAKYPDTIWRVAVFHVSPWSGGHRGEREWTVGRRESMLGELQRLGFDLVFCGHDHNYQRIKPLRLKGTQGNPVQIVITGVTGSGYYNAEGKDYTLKVVNRRDHLCVVDAARDKLKIRAVTPNGELIDEFEMHRGRPTTDVHEVEPASTGRK